MIPNAQNEESGFNNLEGCFKAVWPCASLWSGSLAGQDNGVWPILLHHLWAQGVKLKYSALHHAILHVLLMQVDLTSPYVHVCMKLETFSW